MAAAEIKVVLRAGIRAPLARVGPVSCSAVCINFRRNNAVEALKVMFFRKMLVRFPENGYICGVSMKRYALSV